MSTIVLGGGFLAIWLAGFVTSMAFNATFDLPPAFADESPLSAWKWGLMSVIPPVIYMTVASVAYLTLVSIHKFCAQLWPTYAAWSGRLSTRLDAVATRLGLKDPANLARSMLLLQVMAAAGVLWLFADLFRALMNYSSVDRPVGLDVLSPDYYETLAGHRAAANVIILGMFAGSWTVWKRQSLSGTSGLPAAIVAGLGASLFLILLIVAPYRTVVYNSFTRVDLGDTRCYQIGQRHDQRKLLLHCPELPLPRNREVADDDPRLRQTGTFESIFTRPKERR